MNEKSFQRFLPILISIFILLALDGDILAGQSAIVTAEGYSCLGVDKSRRETEKEARAEAKRNAVENALTLIRSATQIKDLQVEKDLIEAYAHGKVTVLEEIKEKTGWYRDPAMGDCFRYHIKAEVIPDEQALIKVTSKQDLTDDPSSPLNVRLWTGKKEYRAGEKVKIFLKGNRPFYARILYRDVRGNLVQILPNPYRRDNYFQGGIVYELPEGNKDRFQLEVTPPFGQERIILHASSTSLGELDLEDKGAIYQVKNTEKEIWIKSRGIKIVAGTEASQGDTEGAEFFETRIEISTHK